MPRSPAYDEDLAYIHDVGFGAFARESAPGVLEILRQAGIGNGTVIDLGCGSGIWAEVLVAAGYDVVGVDLSPAFVAMSRRQVPQAEFHVASYLDFKLPRCRAVTALGEVLGYRHDKRNGPAALKKLFRRVYRALVSGGVFVFDVAEPERHRRSGRNFWEGSDWAVLAEFDNDAQSRQLTRRIVTFREVTGHYRRGEETHVLQLYRGSELAETLREIGFRVRSVRSYGNYRLQDGMVALIARKP